MKVFYFANWCSSSHWLAKSQCWLSLVAVVVMSFENKPYKYVFIIIITIKFIIIVIIINDIYHYLT